jgi:phosphoserine phosphatase
MRRAGTTAYPDISDILARKAEARREIARRTFGEKIAMVEALRERLAPLKRAREQQIAARTAQHSPADRRK